MSLVLANSSLVLYGDKAGKVNFLNLETSVCTRLVPSVKLGMDKYRYDKRNVMEGLSLIIYVSENHSSSMTALLTPWCSSRVRSSW